MKIGPCSALVLALLAAARPGTASPVRVRAGVMLGGSHAIAATLEAEMDRSAAGFEFGRSVYFSGWGVFLKRYTEDPAGARWFGGIEYLPLVYAVDGRTLGIVNAFSAFGGGEAGFNPGDSPRHRLSAAAAVHAGWIPVGFDTGRLSYFLPDSGLAILNPFGLDAIQLRTPAGLSGWISPSASLAAGLAEI